MVPEIICCVDFGVLSSPAPTRSLWQNHSPPARFSSDRILRKSHRPLDSFAFTLPSLPAFAAVLPAVI